MTSESTFFNQFLYEYTSTDNMVSKTNQKLRTESKHMFIAPRHERTTEIVIYIGRSSGNFSRAELEDRPKIDFCSGSSYIGEWNQFGMCGKGIFTFPNGVRFEGHLSEGLFQGKGKLIYPNGIVIRATWVDGKAKHTGLVFSDGLKFKKHHWKYCQYPDRRYRTCVENGIPAVGQSYVAPTRPARFIPEGCYDTIDGIFNPKLKVVYNPDTRHIIRIPTQKECDWIILNCRRGTFNEIPEHRKPVHIESNYVFDEIRLKALSNCSSSHQGGVKFS